MNASSQAARFVGKAAIGLASCAVAASALGACSSPSATHHVNPAPVASVATTSSGSTSNTGATDGGTSEPQAGAFGGRSLPAGYTGPQDVMTDMPANAVARNTIGTWSLGWGGYGGIKGAVTGAEPTLTAGQAAMKVLGMGKGH